jgi:hypothetical protein
MKKKINNYVSYAGYIWGWITEDGSRHSLGADCKAMPDTIVGIWSEVKRLDIETPFCHEIFLAEYTRSDKGSWVDSPLAMLQRLSRNQAFNLAYADKTDTVSAENSIVELPAADPILETVRHLQKWRCIKCNHTFYTPYEKERSLIKRIKDLCIKLIGRSLKIKCEVCSEMQAIKSRVITKPIR